MNTVQWLIIGITAVLILIALYYLLCKRNIDSTWERDITPRSVLGIIKIFQALNSVPRLRELRINQRESPKVYLGSPEEVSMTYDEIVEWAGIPFGSLPYKVMDNLGNKLGDLSENGTCVFINKLITENPTSFLATLCRELSRKVLLCCGLSTEANDPAFVDVTCAYLGFSTLMLNSRYDVCDIYISTDKGVKLSLIPPGIVQIDRYESRFIPVGVFPTPLVAVLNLLSVGMGYGPKKECSKLSAQSKAAVAQMRKVLKKMGLVLIRGEAMSQTEWLAINETACCRAISGI